MFLKKIIKKLRRHEKRYDAVGNFLDALPAMASLAIMPQAQKSINNYIDDIENLDYGECEDYLSLDDYIFDNTTLESFIKENGKPIICDNKDYTELYTLVYPDKYIFLARSDNNSHILTYAELLPNNEKNLILGIYIGMHHKALKENRYFSHMKYDNRKNTYFYVNSVFAVEVKLNKDIVVGITYTRYDISPENFTPKL